MEWRTRAALLGLPLVHVAMGRGENGSYRRGVAVGWVAVGDVACGVLVAVGGVALGGVAIGGLAVGGMALAGLALGLCALGGMALGLVAVGGAAIGWFGAIGGLAVARELALGGVAVAEHANDAVAQQVFATRAIYRLPRAALDYAVVLVLLPTAMGLVERWRRARRPPAP